MLERTEMATRLGVAQSRDRHDKGQVQQDTGLAPGTGEAGDRHGRGRVQQAWPQGRAQEGTGMELC